MNFFISASLSLLAVPTRLTVMETKVTQAAAQSVEALFLQYRGPLLRYLSGLLPNPDDAAEVLQETYLRLLRQDSPDRLGGDARAYLFQVATNLVRDYFRQRKAYRADRHTSLDAPAFDLELHVPAASIGLDDTLSRFKSALKALKPRCGLSFCCTGFMG
jgi:DNA-directed RNA polymerase specialized sigma24 family protein